MVGFPKVIKTKADLANTFKLVKKGRLKAEDWLAEFYLLPYPGENRG